MILPDFKAFPRAGRIIGLDWGARRTGVAVCDPSRQFIFTRPAIVTPRGDASWARRVSDIITAEGVVGIVVGMPVHADGTPGDAAADIRSDVMQLATYTDLPICFIEENLTSVAAQEQMGRVRISDIKQRLDSESARVILENAIAVMCRI